MGGQARDGVDDQVGALVPDQRADKADAQSSAWVGHPPLSGQRDEPVVRDDHVLGGEAERCVLARQRGRRRHCDVEIGEGEARSGQPLVDRRGVEGVASGAPERSACRAGRAGRQSAQCRGKPEQRCRRRAAGELAVAQLRVKGEAGKQRAQRAGSMAWHTCDSSRRMRWPPEGQTSV